MEEVVRRGRGRPPLVTTAKEEMKAPQTDAAPAKRRRRASVGGHALKLTAPVRPGYTRRWFNDDGNRLAEADELAYDFVCDPSIKSNDVGSRISRLVGTKANGDPLRAYLMETPDELYAEGLSEKDADIRAREEPILTGQDPSNPIAPRAELTGQVSIQRG